MVRNISFENNDNMVNILDFYYCKSASVFKTYMNEALSNNKSFQELLLTYVVLLDRLSDSTIKHGSQGSKMVYFLNVERTANKFFRHKNRETTLINEERNKQYHDRQMTFRFAWTHTEKQDGEILKLILFSHRQIFNRMMMPDMLQVSEEMVNLLIVDILKTIKETWENYIQ